MKGFSERAIAETLDALKRAGLVNDEELARFLDDLGRNVRLLGGRGVKHFLRARGIREELLPAGDADAEEFERALRVLEKKRKSLEGYAAQVGRRKLSGYLGRRGYSQETIRRVLDHAFPPPDRP